MEAFTPAGRTPQTATDVAPSDRLPNVWHVGWLEPEVADVFCDWIMATSRWAVRRDDYGLITFTGRQQDWNLCMQRFFGFIEGMRLESSLRERKAVS